MAKKLWIEEFGAVEYAENHTDNGNSWEDKTSDMFAWDSSTRIMDWSRRRDMILPLIYAITGLTLANYNDLTHDQKILACNYFAVPYSLRVLNGIITEEEDFNNGAFLLSQTKISRVNCIEAMRKAVWNDFVRINLMTLTQSQQMLADIEEDFDKIKWFIDSNDMAFRNWIFGLTPYIGVFASKNYYSVELQTILQNIYNGDY